MTALQRPTLEGVGAVAAATHPPAGGCAAAGGCCTAGSSGAELGDGTQLVRASVLTPSCFPLARGDHLRALLLRRPAAVLSGTHSIVSAASRRPGGSFRFMVGGLYEVRCARAWCAGCRRLWRCPDCF